MNSRQDARKSQTSHHPNPRSYYTRPPRGCQDNLFAQGRAVPRVRPQASDQRLVFQAPLFTVYPKDDPDESPTARDERAHSYPVRSASTGDSPGHPSCWRLFQHPVRADCPQSPDSKPLACLCGPVRRSPAGVGQKYWRNRDRPLPLPARVRRGTGGHPAPAECSL